MKKEKRLRKERDLLLDAIVRLANSDIPGYDTADRDLRYLRFVDFARETIDERMRLRERLGVE